MARGGCWELWLSQSTLLWQNKLLETHVAGGEIFSLHSTESHTNTREYVEEKHLGGVTKAREQETVVAGAARIP